MRKSARLIAADRLTLLMGRTPHLDTLKKVAAKSGVGYGTVQRVSRAEASVTIDNIEAIAAAFGLTLDEFLKRDFPSSDAGADLPTTTVLQAEEITPEYAEKSVIFHTESRAPVLYDVPIFELEDLHLARDTLTALPPEHPRTPSTFGGPGIVSAEMADDSMTCADGDSIPRGTLLFVDLDAQPRVGNLVVVRMTDGRCYLRELVSDAGRWKLMPHNPKYDPAPAPADRAAYVGVLVRTHFVRDWTLK